MKRIKFGSYKRMKNFLGIDIIISMIGIFLGILSLVFDIGILATLALVVLGISAIIDGKGNVRF